MMLPSARTPVRPFTFELPGNIFREPVTLPFNSGQDGFILQDSSGGLWSVGVQDNGQLQTNSVASGIVTSVILSDMQQTTSWQLGVMMNGQLLTTQLTFSPYVTIRWMGSVTGLTVWGLGVLTDGQLFTQTTPTLLDDSCFAGFVKVPSVMSANQGGW